MDFFRFLFSKKFLKHLAFAIIIFAVLVLIVFLFLNLYTKHGQYLNVPNFTGMKIDQVMGNPDYKDFDFVVIDSIYDLRQTKGIILHQDPFPESKVKKNRMIYLTIVSFVPEKTSMPDLKFLTFRQAVSVLQSCGLKTGRITYIQTFDADAVQEQFFEGKVILPGIKIDKGSAIDLTVGMGAKGQAEDLEAETDSVPSDSI